MSSETSPTEQQVSRTERWLRFDRRDRLSLRVVLWLVAAGTAAYGIVRPVTDWIRGSSVSVDLLQDGLVPTLDSAGVPYRSELAVSVLVDDPTVGQRLATVLPGVVFTVVVAVLVTLLSRVVNDIGDDRLFQVRNVRRLRVMALVLMFGFAAGSWIAGFAQAVLVPSDLPSFGVTVDTLPILLPALLGLIVALAAEAVRSGIALREAADGVI